jgi:hypothetical protein
MNEKNYIFANKNYNPKNKNVRKVEQFFFKETNNYTFGNKKHYIKG